MAANKSSLVPIRSRVPVPDRGQVPVYALHELFLGCIFVVSTGDICGGAGCGSTFLAGQGFTSKEVNPQSIGVLAEAHSDPRDWSRISAPRLVTIAPADAVIAPRAWSLLCSSGRSGGETTAGQRA